MGIVLPFEGDITPKPVFIRLGLHAATKHAVKPKERAYLPYCPLYLLDKTYSILWIVCHMKGLKTGMYYLRTRPAANAIQFTVDKSRLQQRNRKSVDEADNEVTKQTEAMLMCSLQNRESCVMCSS